MAVKRRGASWQAAYRGPDKRERTQTFAKKVEAERWVTDEVAKMNRGAWIDPTSGKVPFRDFALAWQASQVTRASTRLLVDSHVRIHMLPTFGDRPIASIRPSEVQSWVRSLSDELAPGTVRVIVQHFRAIMKAATVDQVVSRNPCDGLRLPQHPHRQVEPLSTAAVLALIDALPDQYRGLAVLGAGAGLRPGEALGVTLDELDLLRRTLTVRHQLVTLPGEAPTLAPLKTASSLRVVPLPDFVALALARHVELAGGRESIAGRPSGLLFTDDRGDPIARNRFGDIWRAAVKASKQPIGTRHHDLRHFYASLLIAHGESVKVVQARLGHASAVETLNVYSHLWPDSEDSTRKAIDGVLSVESLPGLADISRT